MARSIGYKYKGIELDLFAHAINWKKYWSSLIKGYIKGDVLEVGAGNGNNITFLNPKLSSKWTCLEPDKELARHLSRIITEKSYYYNIKVINGTILSLSSEQLFDTIIYIDVLEHIKDDKNELKKASEHLKPGGRLIILSPALQSLYSEFDKEIGHFRRYSKSSLENIIPTNLISKRIIYLDTIGVLVSMANRILLKQNTPNMKQIRIWDRIIIPCSKHVDRLFGYRYGKSILAILVKQ